MQRDRKQTSGCPGLVVGGCGQMAVTAQWVQNFLLLQWKCLVLDGVVVTQHWECTKCHWIGQLQMDIFLLWPSSYNPCLSDHLKLLQCCLSAVVVVVTQSCLTLCDPMDCSTPGSLSFTISHSLLKLMSIESTMPSNHLILCRPLPLLPSVFLNIRIFSNESVLLIRWPKYWSFCFSISSSNKYSGLISFRIDWLYLLAVQGTQESATSQLKSINSSAFNFLYGLTLTSIHDYWKKHSFD